MNADPDRELRDRLRALVDAVPVGRLEREGTSTAAQDRRGPLWRLAALPAVVVVAAVVMLLVTTAPAQMPDAGAPDAASPSPTATTSAPLPSTISTMLALPSAAVDPSGPAPTGGLARDVAVAIARDRLDSGAQFLRVDAGRFEDVASDARVEPDASPGADTLVWAVRFTQTFAPCPPDGSACLSPRPGVTTVVLDYETGTFIMSYGIAPKPS